MESNKMPRGIPFIIANEFAERFCYYGINAILAIYMTTTLHFGQARATSWQSLFKVGRLLLSVVRGHRLGCVLGQVPNHHHLFHRLCAGLLGPGAGAVHAARPGARAWFHGLRNRRHKALRVDECG